MVGHTAAQPSGAGEPGLARARGPVPTDRARRLTSAATGGSFIAQITRGDAEALNLRDGDTVYVRATRVPSLPGGTDVPKADEADEDALSKA